MYLGEVRSEVDAHDPEDVLYWEGEEREALKERGREVYEGGTREGCVRNLTTPTRVV